MEKDPAWYIHAMAHHHTNRPFKEKLKDVLALNSSERRGVALLMGLCLLAAAWVAYEELIHPRPAEDMAALQAAWEPMAASIASDSGGAQRSDRQSDRRVPVLFHFDPNGLPVEQWMELGLTGRQAEAISMSSVNSGRRNTRILPVWTLVAAMNSLRSSEARNFGKSINFATTSRSGLMSSGLKS